MLKLSIPPTELFDEINEEFIDVEGFEVELEHSLVSVSKWESIFRKPFLDKGSKSREEILAYVEAMIISPDYPSDFAERLNANHYEEINDYINSSQSATTFGHMPQRGGPSETITSELIYYWMVAFNVPFECQYWHLNRLFSLIRICNLKQQKPQKMTKSEVAARNRELNAKRRAELNTSG